MTPTLEQGALSKFWSDDFDMDLLKIFPDVPRMLECPDAALWTVGHTSYGRLNNPCCWNSRGLQRERVGGDAYVAFAWLEKPILERDEHGWFSINGCVSHEPEVECTWLEWLRDSWVHNYITVILPTRAKLPAMQWPTFQAIMSDLRGWQKSDNIQEHYKTALRWLMRCERIFNEARKRSPE